MMILLYESAYLSTYCDGLKIPPKREGKLRNATVHDKLLLQHTYSSYLSGLINRIFVCVFTYLLHGAG